MPEMFHIEVSVGWKGSALSKGRVLMSQDRCARSTQIIIHPDQVPIIINWLQEAAAEAKTQDSGA